MSLNKSLLMLVFYLFASLDLYCDEYSMIKDENHAKESYFIKIAALNSIKNAKKISLSTDFPTRIIFMRDYYSVISKDFALKEDAKRFLKKVRKKYKKAYLITLYKSTKRKKSIKKRKSSPLQDAARLYENKRYEEALAMFDRILIENPTNEKAALYYAKTLYKLKLYKEAKNRFDELLKKPFAKEEAREYLKKIKKRDKRNFFQTIFSIGAGYDDNVNLNSDKNTTVYGPYTLLNDTSKTKSAYAIAALLLQHGYKAEKFNIDSSFYTYNELLHSAKGNDLNFFDFSIAFSKDFDTFSLILPIGLNYLLLDSKTISYNLYATPRLKYTINRKLAAALFAIYNDNHTKFADNRDYISYGGGFEIKYLHDRLLMQNSVTYEKFDEKKTPRYDINKDLVKFTLLGRYALFTNFYLGSGITYEDHRYKDLDQILGYKREDKKTILYASVMKKLTTRSTAVIVCRHTDNSSNINIFDYKKNNCSLEYKYRF